MREVGICGEPGRQYAYKDNGADILLVAHLDTVLNSDLFGTMKYGSDTLVFSPELDDRLGVYLVLDYLPILGLSFDILLTDHEEIGQTTASEFLPDKQYSAIIELDRGGTDAVLYQYRGGNLEEVASGFFKIGLGSYSDISAMDHCGCQCINIGVGYHDAHTDMCNASMGDIRDQMSALAEFIAAISGETFPYEPRPMQDRRSFWDYTDDRADQEENCPHCPICGEELLNWTDTEHGPECIWCGEILDESLLIE